MDISWPVILATVHLQFAGRALPSDIDAAADTLRQCKLIVMQLEIPLETIYHTIALANEVYKLGVNYVVYAMTH